LSRLYGKQKMIRTANRPPTRGPLVLHWVSFLFCRSFSCHFQIDPADLQSSIYSTVLVHLPTNILKDMAQQAVTRALMEVPEQNIKAIIRPYQRPEDNSSSTIYETRYSCRSWRGKTPSEGHTASSSFPDKARLDSSGLHSSPKILDHLCKTDKPSGYKRNLLSLGLGRQHHTHGRESKGVCSLASLQ
jgi:hypothetical protein